MLDGVESQGLALFRACHSDPAVAGEESRTGDKGLEGFLSRDCGIGMTGGSACFQAVSIHRYKQRLRPSGP